MAFRTHELESEAASPARRNASPAPGALVPTTASRIAFLQRTAGNLAVGRLIAGEAMPGGPGRPSVQRAAGSPPRQERGSRGVLVEAVQGLLGAVGHPVTIDGIFGRGTREAVIAFQGESGLVADGIVGRRTWAALLEGLGLELDPTSGAGGLEHQVPGGTGLDHQVPGGPGEQSGTTGGPTLMPVSPAELDPLKSLYRAARRNVWARLIARYTTSEWTQIGIGGVGDDERPRTMEQVDPLLARWQEIRGSSWYWPLTQTIRSVLPYVGGEWTEAGLGGGESEEATGGTATDHQVATDWGTDEAAAAGSAGPGPERLGEDEGWAE